MIEAILKREHKSADMMAFEYWLRTGRHLDFKSLLSAREAKFNPNHDPNNGRFTFGPGGGSLLPRRSKPKEARAPSLRPSPARQENTNDTLQVADESRAKLIHAQFRPNPRVRIGGNGPPINDPMIIEHVFPVLADSPAAGSIVSMADNILDITGPAARLTTGLAMEHTNQLVRQIREIDPSYRLETLGFPQTFEGQMNLIRHLRVERAVAFQRVRGELQPMQVEVLRNLQEQADHAYVRGLAAYNAGALRVRLSREEAIGNFVDREVRNNLREFYNQYGVQVTQTGPIRIIGREYESQGNDRTYRIPDARVGNIAFDVSLTRKTNSTPQIRGFFSADFQPDTVVIVRPSQLGANHTYAIARRRNGK